MDWNWEDCADDLWKRVGSQSFLWFWDKKHKKFGFLTAKFDAIVVGANKPGVKIYRVTRKDTIDITDRLVEIKCSSLENGKVHRTEPYYEAQVQLEQRFWEISMWFCQVWLQGLLGREKIGQSKLWWGKIGPGKFRRV